MDIALDPEIEERIRDKVRSGEFHSAGEVIQQALHCFLDVDGEDLAETPAAIAEAVEQSARDEVPAESVFDELRSKYGVPR